MEAKKISLRVGGWFGEKEIELAFPSNWEVTERRMAGHDKPALMDEEIRSALRNTLGTPRLSELARGKKKVIILFDDIPKPTPVWRIVPFVLEELHAGGINDEQIRFLSAPGTHRYMTYQELAAKLGADVIEKYPVYQHNIYENTVLIGTTRAGMPVHVNREFASCDLKLGIGSIIPHQFAGFGGGGKMIMPGISGIQTIAHHHKTMRSTFLETAKLGRVDDNAFRLEIEEAARLAGLQFRVDAVLNNRREIVGLFAGEFVAEHRSGVKLARQVYATEMLREMDVLINNGYPDECQITRSSWTVPISLRQGGDVVMVNHAHSGQVVHQWNGRFGTDYGGAGWKAGGKSAHFEKASRVIIMAPFLTKADRLELGEKVVWYKSWGEVLAELVSRHGPGTKVGVYPYPPIQLPVL